MDYEQIERETYERIWGSLKGEFSNKGATYFKSQPSLTVLDFLSFLERRGVSGSVLDIGNTKDYMLFESFDRFFRDGYVNPSDAPITFEHKLPPSELPALADKMALDMAIKVYHIYNWIPANAAIRNLVEDQKKLIERRL